MRGHERFLLRIAYIASTILAVLICLASIPISPVVAAACAAIACWSVFELIILEGGDDV